MAKERPVQYRFFIRRPEDTEPVPLETLTPEELDAAKQSMSRRLSETMSRYYSNHMDQYQKL